ncbi:rRNA maturation RNase YbeY [Salirhabdus salicampi]|uniref:rRNA maturation RNase YbeY n=1 Tax=Salirhabdus salicampi TaxID=476102 RepID=UPI0020C35418|nr:rRNA maturation RNase YbeY [Salirhabdus salicampi]MCP8616898.1 rRNA maturation RNase YbeY [Salirhabdus salicampi]
MIIDFQDETNEVTKDHKELIEKLLVFAGSKEGVKEDGEVSITFVSDQQIQEINREYRHKDQPTDVISFAMQEEGDGEMPIYDDKQPILLGDIIISIERAKEQASDYGHTLERELGFLALHGFLHLLGYDHMSEEEEQEMFQKQEAILQEFGLKRDGKE